MGVELFGDVEQPVRRVEVCLDPLSQGLSPHEFGHLRGGGRQERYFVRISDDQGARSLLPAQSEYDSSSWGEVVHLCKQKNWSDER